VPAAASISRSFEQLRKGDTFATDSRTVTEADLAAFAAQTGDLHPQHLDPTWAASTVFSERIAPGALTLSYALGLVQVDPEWAVALRGMTDVVFTRPVKIGDTLSVTGRITALAPLDAGSGLVTITLLTANQHGKPVCRARVQMMWKRRPVPLQTDQGTA
jgi:3-hydroxybutyryl-CoA dehydratase